MAKQNERVEGKAVGELPALVWMAGQVASAGRGLDPEAVVATAAKILEECEKRLALTPKAVE